MLCRVRGIALAALFAWWSLVLTARGAMSENEY
jgi:hypothetical protein